MMLCNIIQLMTLDEVNTTIYQPQRSDYHRGHHKKNKKYAVSQRNT